MITKKDLDYTYSRAVEKNKENYETLGAKIFNKKFKTILKQIKKGHNDVIIAIWGTEKYECFNEFLNKNYNTLGIRQREESLKLPWIPLYLLHLCGWNYVAEPVDPNNILKKSLYK